MIDRRNLLVMGAAGAAGLAYAYWPRGGDAPLLPGLTGAAQAQGTTAIQDVTLGDPNAPVTVVEYASFTCPHCASFHANTFKDFKRDYIDTGRVHFVYREVFFDRYGLWASMVARCAGPDRYFGVVDLLYREQSNWARQGDAAAVAESLKRIGAQAGLDQATLDACLQDADMAQSLVAWYESNAARDGVRSTPSFLIDGQMHSGSLSLAQLGALVDDAAG
ncbi:DsbA family protein [Jannaschia sp. LMIT008]|uniref:DsbA family protein n=1 Tax=Jannaschia maritima TaxID=3032585 RepID=UPI00281105A2|nr:DsbA family protein [Jannaschia sp. LMIT008]